MFFYSLVLFHLFPALQQFSFEYVRLQLDTTRQSSGHMQSKTAYYSIFPRIRTPHCRNSFLNGNSIYTWISSQSFPDFKLCTASCLPCSTDVFRVFRNKVRSNRFAAMLVYKKWALLFFNPTPLGAFSFLPKPLPISRPRWRTLHQDALARQNTPASCFFLILSFFLLYWWFLEKTVPGRGFY